MGRSQRIPNDGRFAHWLRVIGGKLQPTGKAHLHIIPNNVSRHFLSLPVACVPYTEKIIICHWSVLVWQCRNAEGRPTAHARRMVSVRIAGVGIQVRRYRFAVALAVSPSRVSCPASQHRLVNLGNGGVRPYPMEVIAPLHLPRNE